MPNYEELFKSVGVKLERKKDNYLGASLQETDSGLEISRNTFKGSPAYRAGLTSGDIILSLNGTKLQTQKQLDEIIQNSEEEKIEVSYQRFGEKKTTMVQLGENPVYSISLDEDALREAVKNRKNWLEAK